MVKPIILAVVQWIAAAELPVFILISPAFMFPTPKRLIVLAVVPIIWFCTRITTGHFLPRTPLNSVLCLMLVMVGVSLCATFDVDFSLGKVAGVLLGVLLFWAGARWITTPARLAVGSAVFVAAGVALAVVGLLGTNWFEKFPILSAVLAKLPKAIRGLRGAEEGFQPNAVAGCLVMFVPLQAALAWRAIADQRAARPGARLKPRLALATSVVALGITGVTLLLTQSRGAWIGMAMAGLAFCTWHSRHTRWLAALVLVSALGAGVIVGPERLASSAISRAGPGMATNVDDRLDLWSQAICGIQDFPLTGMGMNAFRKVMPALYPAPGYLSSPDFDVAHAHNHLLQVALDLGAPGLVAYLALWGLLITMLSQVYGAATEPWMRTTAGGVGAGLIAHFSFGMTDAIPLGAKVGILFWLAAALVVGLHQVCCLPQFRVSNIHSVASR